MVFTRYKDVNVDFKYVDAQFIELKKEIMLPKEFLKTSKVDTDEVPVQFLYYMFGFHQKLITSEYFYKHLKCSNYIIIPTKELSISGSINYPKIQDIDLDLEILLKNLLENQIPTDYSSGAIYLLKKLINEL